MPTGKPLLAAAQAIALLFGTLLPLSAGAITQNDFLHLTFTVGTDVSDAGVDAVAVAAEALWTAYDAAGSPPSMVTTGTLTQTAPGSEVFTYSPSPADRLRVVFTSGPEIGITYNTVNGYTANTWQDFTDSHNSFIFTLVQVGSVDLSVTSSSIPGTETIDWDRTITGSVTTADGNFTVDVRHTGSKNYEVGTGSAAFTRQDQVRGTVTGAGASFVIDEWSSFSMAHNSITGSFAQNRELRNNGSSTMGGTTFQVQNAYAFWATGSQLLGSSRYFDTVIDSHQWEVSGSVFRNGAVFGTMQFSYVPYDYASPCPNLVVHAAGGDIPVHPLSATLVPEPSQAVTTLAAFVVLALLARTRQVSERV